MPAFTCPWCSFSMLVEDHQLTSFKAHLLRRHQVTTFQISQFQWFNYFAKVEEGECAFLPFLSPEEKSLLVELVRDKVLGMMRGI